VFSVLISDSLSWVKFEPEVNRLLRSHLRKRSQVSQNPSHPASAIPNCEQKVAVVQQQKRHQKRDVSPSEDSNDEDSEYKGTGTEGNDNDVEKLTEMTVVLLRTVKCQPNANVRAAIVLKNGEGAMIHAVTRGAVTVILPLMLLLAEVILHAALVPPPEKIQVKACLLHLKQR
jgi:hypothetical protein